MSFWDPVLAGTTLQAILLGLASFTAYRAGCALLPASSDALERAFVVGMVGVIGWVALLQILGLLGVLWLPVVLACLATLALLSLRLPRPSPLPIGRWSGETWTTIAWAAPFVALAVVVVLAGPPGLNSYDSLHYQIPNAAHVLNTGSIRTLPFALPGESSGAAPGNGTLLLLSMMLAFHTAELTGLVDVFFAMLIVAVTAMIGRELGRNAWTGALAGLMLVTTVAFFASQMRSAYDDSAALLGLLSGMAFGLRFARTGHHRWLLLAGASIGLAAGAKAAYLVPAAVVAVAVLWTSLRQWRSPGSLFAFVAVVLGLCVVWYVRNWVITGDPFYPEPVRLGPWSLFAGLSAAESASRNYEQTLVDVFLGRGTSIGAWLGLTIINFGGVAPAALLSIAVMVRGRGAARMIAAVAVGCALAYAVTPFSGSTDPIQVDAALRFLMPAAAFGVLAVSAAMADRWLRLLSVFALGTDTVILLIVESRNGFVDPTLLAIAAALAFVILAAVRWRHALRDLVGRRSVRGGLSVLIAAAAVVATAHLQAAPDPSPVDAALSAADHSDLPVLLFDVGDVAALLGPNLKGNVVAAGIGPVGAERPIRSITQLNARITALHPALVVISDIADFDVVPPGWTPRPAWRSLGIEDGFAVYKT